MKDEDRRGPGASRTLWCGRVQGLCEGNICQHCHLFIGRSLVPLEKPSDTGYDGTMLACSVIDTPTLTDGVKRKKA